MCSVNRARVLVKCRWNNVSKSCNGSSLIGYGTSKTSSDVGFAAFSSTTNQMSLIVDSSKRGLLGATGQYIGIGGLLRRNQTYHLTEINAENPKMPCFARAFASTPSGKDSSKHKGEISTVEDPFDDAPTYNIPEKPVTFTEGASYSVIILAGLGIAAAAGYAVFTELIFSPKEYKIFTIALKRIQNDSQVSVRIGSPVTGYGQDSMNRAARQRIPHRVWTDEDGVEHVEVNFFVRGPHGYGKVFTEMFKDKEDKQWKFTYMIVEIIRPSPAQLMLESYIPGAAAPA